MTIKAIYSRPGYGRTAAAVLVFLACLTLPLFAQSLRVEYLEGSVEQSTTSGWKELNPGDVLQPSSKIRLQEGGYAELSQGSLKVAVSEAGTYLLSDLLNASRKVSSWSLGSLVSGKIKTALTGGQKSATAVMGVRGAAAGSPGEVNWIESEESQEILKQGRELLAKARYQEAVDVFQKGLAEAYGAEENEYLYYIAYSYSQQGRTAQALRSVESMQITPESSLYADMVFLKGRLLMESLAFTDALELFAKQLRANPEGDFAQALLILSSYCYRGLGKLAEAKESLQKAVRLSTDSELGREAAKLLREL